MTDHVAVSAAGGVLTLTLTRAEKKNALTHAMYDALVAGLAAAMADPAIRVCVLTGSGDSFTAGNDLLDFMQTPPDVTGDSAVARFLGALTAFEKPLVAKVNGLAVGVGVTMLLHCDLVYADQTARLSLPFAALGLVPEAASSLLLPRLVGHQKAAELLFFGAGFSAAEAERLGLVNTAVPAAALDALVAERTAALAALAPSALRLTKRLLRSASSTVAERMREESALFVAQLHSPEVAEAIGAFLARRKPDFSHFAA